MTDEQISDNFKYLIAEIDTLRARSDVLAIALKHTILNSADPEATLETVIKKLDRSNVAALFSSAPTESYVSAFDIAVSAVARWRESLPPAAQ
ncbi:hypothetical protein C6P96_04890 [Burkholderia multivorans]|uniref:hypothetical protein n=1 Tax=Burkholderia TaxID=32008 RepID=UPI000CFF53F7|nr:MULTISPECIES: hypothetical protein [Burkholderia]MBR8021214.1 hypothetical protein [Burkholderia multivorans]MBU9391806.1 hypothetical protein [Burkholderia multivorans]MBU9489964.1 hypothetical protein [Burkholderia multivorans]MBU9502858.1 hypothetical protein [Burkholderia multivorans]PRE60572.1 hypothetical protein C6P95_25210 [Burkholderia multivorans]